MKALKVIGVVGRFSLAGLLIVGTFIMNCIGLLIGLIARG